MAADPKDVIVECSEPERIIGCIDSLMPLLDKTVVRKLNELKAAVFMSEGYQGLFDRTVGRSVSEILQDTTMPSLGDVAAEGEIDGTTYTVFKSNDDS